MTDTAAAFKVEEMRGSIRNRVEENIISEMKFGHAGLNSILNITNKHAIKNVADYRKWWSTHKSCTSVKVMQDTFKTQELIAVEV